MKAIDTYWICTAEHGLNASTFAARIVASTGADCGAALSSAVGALSGPLHGGAPAYVKPMLEEVAAMGDPDKWVKDTLDSGKRIMGFGHRIYRAEDPRSRILKETARELGSPQIEIAERLEEAALAELERRQPERPLKTNVEYYSAVVLDIAEIPPPLAPAMFACSRVAGWSAHILEQKRTGRLFRPSAHVHRAGAAQSRRGQLTLAEAAAQADALAEAGSEQELSKLRAEWSDEIEAAARNADYRERAVAYRAIGQFRFRQKIELLRRGLEDESPSVPRLGARLARAALAGQPRRRQRRAAAAAQAGERGRQPGRARGWRSSASRTARRSARRSSLLAAGSPRGRPSCATARGLAAKVGAQLRKVAGTAAHERRPRLSRFTAVLIDRSAPRRAGARRSRRRGGACP